MNIPNLPTDNLYKFLAIFGLVLMIYGSYMLVQTPEKLISNVEQLNVSKQLMLFNAKMDTTKSIQTTCNTKIEHLRDSLTFDAKFKGLQRDVNNLTKFVLLYLGLFGCGVFLSIRGFILWYKRTQQFNDKILENESKKIENDKSILVHKIQFEKEFQVYNDLWSNLIKLRNATSDLRPLFTPYTKTESEEVERRKKIFDEFNDSFKNCVITFDFNKPFYPENIYKEIELILRVSRREAIETSYMHPQESEYYENAEKNMNSIIEKIEIVCIIIRTRIGILKSLN